MEFTLNDRQALIRYRFGTRTADFLMCGQCGVYVGAQMEQAGRYYAIANLRTLDGEGEPATVQAMDYSHEDVEERRTRRVSRWTPVRLPVKF
jgi:hypothetical protein